MGRPPRFDVDTLLDAAATLAAAEGPRALTMAALARAAGAPNGSVYHRFPDQPSLLAALWLRTVTRFQDGVLSALVEEPPRAAAIAAARRAVDWSRANPEQARILLAGPRAFGKADWSARDAEVGAELSARLEQALAGLAERLGVADQRGRSRVVLAVVDLPYAVIRRHLGGDGVIPAEEAELVAEAAAALLDGLG